MLPKHNKALKINGLNFNTRVKQLFDIKHQQETKKIVKKVMGMQS